MRQDPVESMQQLDGADADGGDSQIILDLIEQLTSILSKPRKMLPGASSQRKDAYTCNS
jgi:hypothetical protein